MFLTALGCSAIAFTSARQSGSGGPTAGRSIPKLPETTSKRVPSAVSKNSCSRISSIADLSPESQDISLQSPKNHHLNQTVLVIHFLKLQYSKLGCLPLRLPCLELTWLLQ